MTSLHAPFDDLLRLPFERGGRVEHGVADCLGITLEMARRNGRPLLDPWERLGQLFHSGQPVDHLFSPGWRSVGRHKPMDHDVALLHSDAELAAGYVLGGLLYSASKRHGVFRIATDRIVIQELWRYSP